MIPTGYVSRAYAALQLDVSVEVVDILIEYGSLGSRSIGPSIYVNSDDIAVYRGGNP